MTQLIPNGEVHPVAALFPMMSEEELGELAADIKENGLLNPIVLDENGVLIDGRNRQEACRRAQVEPTYAALNGTDPVAFIMSTNVNRRHLSKGQQAMAMAFAYPEPAKLKRKGSSEIKDQGFSAARLSQARQILSHSRDLALAVLADSERFDDALKKAIDGQEERRSNASKLAQLREEAPDLADLVARELLPLTEAFPTLVKRRNDAHEKKESDRREAEEREKSQRETLCRIGEASYRGIIAWSVAEFSSGLDERLKDESFRAMFVQRMRLERSEIPNIIKGAQILTEILNKL